MKAATHQQRLAETSREMDLLYGSSFGCPSHEDYQEPTPEDHAECHRMLSAPNLTGLRETLALVERLAADADRNRHVQARGPAERHEYRGLATAYRNVAGWLRADIAKLCGERLSVADDEPVDLGEHVGRVPYVACPNCGAHKSADVA